MTFRPDESDIIGSKPKRDETEGLGLFAAPAAQMPGAGQRARAEAREKAEPASAGTRARILATLEAHSTGLTRHELHELTGLPLNTINARVAELRDPRRYAGQPAPVYTEGTRTRVVTDDTGRARSMTESVCHARSVRPPMVQEGAA